MEEFYPDKVKMHIHAVLWLTKHSSGCVYNLIGLLSVTMNLCLNLIFYVKTILMAIFGEMPNKKRIINAYLI